MKLAIIPLWLRKALDSANVEYSKVLSEKELVSILSLDDVAFYFYINEHLSDYFPDLALGDFKTVSFNESAIEEGERVFELMRFRDVRPLADHYHALIGGLQFADNERSGIAFNVKLLDDTTIGVFPYLLDEGACPIKASIHFLDELIKHHLITTPFNVVAKQRHFKKYITKLSNV